MVLVDCWIDLLFVTLCASVALLCGLVGVVTLLVVLLRLVVDLTVWLGV